MKLTVKQMRNIINAAWLETNMNRQSAYSDETRINIAYLHAALFTEAEPYDEIEIKILKPF